MDDKIKTPKKHKMQAELTHLTPSHMLFNALSIASSELAKLNHLSQRDELTSRDFRNYAILISSLTKLSEESRLNSQQSHLNNLTQQEKIDKVQEALRVLEED